jgi:hypothetical protein
MFFYALNESLRFEHTKDQAVVNPGRKHTTHIPSPISWECIPQGTAFGFIGMTDARRNRAF